jgi:phosphoglycerol transferase
MPYVPHPEYPPVLRMTDYDHFRGYLHSRTLHWSYGMIKGRGYDSWYRDEASLPPEELVPALVFAGFHGLYIDRFGYSDRAASLEAKVVRVVGAAPLVSENERFAFFDLAEYAGRLKEGLSEGEWQAKREAGSHPVLYEWRNGFYHNDGLGELDRRWCASRGDLIVHNTGSQARTVKLSMIFSIFHKEPVDLHLDGDLCSADLQISDAGRKFTPTLVVPPGRHVIHFRCDGMLHKFPNDPRKLAFSILHFSSRNEEEAPPAGPVVQR